MRQSRPNCNIFGQARRPAPTKACRGDSLWSPGSKKFDLDTALLIPEILVQTLLIGMDYGIISHEYVNT